MFTCSARDYVRIQGLSLQCLHKPGLLTVHTGQVKGDGDPTCFTRSEDTGVPALQEWCHKLTVSSRSRAARNFFTHLATFAKNVRVYLQGIGEVTEADRYAMKEKWESDMLDDDDDDDDGYNMYGASSDDLGMVPEFRGLMSMKQTKVDQNGEAAGITPRLIRVRVRRLSVGHDRLNIVHRRSSMWSSKIALTSCRNASRMVSRRDAVLAHRT